MTVPSRSEAAALLLSLGPPPWAVAHARAVAEIAAWLTARAVTHGTDVDRGTVEAAALLHDVDKLLPHGDPARALRHGEGSAAWLRGRGHPELADLVAAHPVTRLVDGPSFDAWLATASPGARIVAYADKRAGQRLESMDARFASWRRRYPGAWDETTATAVRARADRLEVDVCAMARVEPAGVRRLAWSGAALRAARADVARAPTRGRASA